jgi:hypothetical protein
MLVQIPDHLFVSLFKAAFRKTASTLADAPGSADQSFASDQVGTCPTLLILSISPCLRSAQEGVTFPTFLSNAS